MDGKKDCKAKLPLLREKEASFGRKDTITRIPLVVVALPRVHVPVAVAGVPVHVDDARSRIPIHLYHHRSNCLRLNLIWGVSRARHGTSVSLLSSSLQARQIGIPTDLCFLRLRMLTLTSNVPVRLRHTEFPKPSPCNHLSQRY